MAIFDPAAKERFLALIEEGASITDAARACDVTPATARRHMSAGVDADFAHAVEGALQTRRETLEAVAFKRAVRGSDRVLIRLLEAEFPDKYAHRSKNETALDARVEVPHDQRVIAARVAAIMAEAERRRAEGQPAPAAFGGDDISEFA